MQQLRTRVQSLEGTSGSPNTRSRRRRSGPATSTARLPTPFRLRPNSPPSDEELIALAGAARGERIAAAALCGFLAPRRTRGQDRRRRGGARRSRPATGGAPDRRAGRGGSSGRRHRPRRLPDGRRNRRRRSTPPGCATCRTPGPNCSRCAISTGTCRSSSTGSPRRARTGRAPPAPARSGRTSSRCVRCSGGRSRK